MNRKLFCTVLAALVLFTTGAQARENLGYLFRTEGYSAEADALIRLVRLELSPQWAEIFNDPKSTEERRVLAELIGAFIDTGVHSKRPIRSLTTAFLISTLDEAKGQSFLQVKLNFAPNGWTRAETLKGMEQLAEAIRSTEGFHESLKLAVVFDPEAKRVEQSAFLERGADVFLVLPAAGSWDRNLVELSLKS